MLTIRVRNKRIKLLNWFIFILVIIFIIYIIGSLIFMIPIFKDVYNDKIIKENYSIDSKITFKNAWLKCNVKEEYVIKANDKEIYNTLENDLLKDGFQNKDKKYVKVIKTFGICKDEKEEYKKYHSKDYVTFKLSGEKEINVVYGEDFSDPYVTAKINNKPIKDIDIISNLNKNKVGKYVITYLLNVSDNYKERLYRTVNVVDNEAPVIKLEGDKELIIDYGALYKDPGFIITDNYDGDITNKVKIKNTINTKKAGVYKVSYSVKDSSGNEAKEERIVTVKEKSTSVSKEEPKIEVKDGITYVNGILLVNKTYGLPKDYDPKVNKEAKKALESMQADAKALGLNLSLISGYRSYKTQENLYNKYVKKDGEEEANTYSAKPGHSEHQTGLAFDIGSVDRSFANTDEAKWIEENAHLYGFIVRYPKGKTDITGYIYEPWHVRYLGKENAKKVWMSGLTLEEYLGIN